jgi:hypothetical protein
MKFHPLALAAFFMAAEQVDAFVMTRSSVVVMPRSSPLAMVDYNLDTGDVLSKREQVLREMEQAEALQRQYQAEAKQSIEEAKALQARVTGGAIGGPAAPIAAATLAAIAVGRDSLNKRQKIIDEQRAKLEEERSKLDNQAKKNQNTFGVSTEN